MPPVAALTAAQRRLYRAALQLFADTGVTRVGVSELAQAAGVARGTVYNNVSDLDGLFFEVAGHLSAEMNERIALVVKEIEDPALRLACGIRYFTRRAHEDPPWGRFMCRFALNTTSLQEIWTGQPVKDLVEGLEKGRYRFKREQLISAVAMLTGVVLGAMLLVLEGRKTWREAGSDAAELVLVALGIPRDEAGVLAGGELPILPPDPL
jgi:AcrR family transcriptional regulator